MIEFRAGAVWWGDLDFAKGGRRKYFVLLSDCEQGEQVLALITTSQGEKHYAGASVGSPCLPTGRAYRIEVRQENCFPLTTWVQFDNAWPISRASLEALVAEGRAGFIQSLSDERIRSILNCAKKSDDIPKRDLALVDRDLKARALAKKQQTVPPKTRTPTTPPAYVSPEITTIHVQVKGFCVGCRGEFAAMIPINDDELTAVFHGTPPSKTNFAIEAQAAIDLLDEQRAKCTECAKLASKSQ